MKSLLVWIAAAFTGLALGFAVFLDQIPQTATPHQGGDAIVVFTGGPDRLDKGMALLSAGQGERLLVSGVHEATSRDDLRGHLEDPYDRFECCVDLDYQALSTKGNAVETARWVNGHGFQSVVVVTAHYHMPRSLIELRRAMPGVTLVPHPVFPERVRSDDEWWRHGPTRSVLASEYLKYLASLLGVSV